LGSVEKAVEDDADRTLTALNGVDEEFGRLEAALDRFQEAAIRSTPDVMKRSAECKRLLFKKIPAELEQVSKEVAKIVTRVAALSGSRIPPIPATLLRPSRLGKLAEAIQRLASGYALERAKK
jgi:hypothetical protein